MGNTKQKVLGARLASIILNEKVKEEVKAEVAQHAKTWKELNFEKIFESQFKELFKNSSPKPSLEINTLKGLKKVKDLRSQKISTLDVGQLSKKAQKSLESEAIKNLVKNRGGTREKLGVKNLLGKIYKNFIDISTTFLVKIQTHKREIIIFAGICIAIYAICSVVRLTFDTPLPSISIDKPLSDQEFLILSDYVIKMLVKVTDTYLELTGGTKVKSPSSSIFADAQPHDFVEVGMGELDGDKITGGIKELHEIMQLICNNPLLEQIVRASTHGRFVLNKDCTITDGLTSAIRVLQAQMRLHYLNNKTFANITQGNERLMKEELGRDLYTCLSDNYHRLLCAHATTDVEFGAHYCPVLFPDLIQPSKRKFGLSIPFLTYLAQWFAIPLTTFVTGYVAGFFKNRPPRNIF